MTSTLNMIRNDMRKDMHDTAHVCELQSMRQFLQALQKPAPTAVYLRRCTWKAETPAATICDSAAAAGRPLFWMHSWSGVQSGLERGDQRHYLH